MKDYFFHAKDASGRTLGKVSLKGDLIPSHLAICMQVIGKYRDAVTYNPLDEEGNEIESFPVNPERYLSFEYVRILRESKRNWLYAKLEFSDGPLKGERANIVGFNYDEGIAKFILYVYGVSEHRYAGPDVLRYATVVCNEHDRELIEEASKCSFIDWSRVYDLAQQAEIENVKEFLINKSHHLYHMEEAWAGDL